MDAGGVYQIFSRFRRECSIVGKNIFVTVAEARRLFVALHEGLFFLMRVAGACRNRSSATILKQLGIRARPEPVRQQDLAVIILFVVAYKIMAILNAFGVPPYKQADESSVR